MCACVCVRESAWVCWLPAVRKLSSDGDTLKRFRSELMWKHTESFTHTHTHTHTHTLFACVLSPHRWVELVCAAADDRSVESPRHRINNLLVMSKLPSLRRQQQTERSGATRGVWAFYKEAHLWQKHHVSAEQTEVWAEAKLNLEVRAESCAEDGGWVPSTILFLENWSGRVETAAAAAGNTDGTSSWNVRGETGDHILHWHSKTRKYVKVLRWERFQ